MAQDKFDLEMVERCFTKCLIEDEDVCNGFLVTLNNILKKLFNFFRYKWMII